MEKLPDNWQTIAGGTLLAGAVTVLAWRFLRKFSKPRKQYPKDTVILHNVARSHHVPSMTPFGIKLETFLRMAKLKYQNETYPVMSSKGKIPWIEYNGEEIADSEFSVQYLNKKFNIDLNGHLTPEEKAIGRAFQKMTEENLYWTIVCDRWIFDKTQGAVKKLNLPFFIGKAIRSSMGKMARAQGMGRHTQEEINEIMRGDLNAISIFLGKKKFLFGDKPCHYDCCVFGMLAEMRWEPFGGVVGKAVEEFPILCAYCDRMKDEFWPDWDECNTAGGTKKATK